MLRKKYKLHGKAISFLLRKKKVYHGDFFCFSYYDYRGGFHRFAFHVSKKVHKSAVFRNFMKRIVLSSLKKNVSTHDPLAGNFYQIFIRVNQKKLIDRQRLVEKLDKKDISYTVDRWFSSDINKFFKFLQNGCG